MKPELAFLALLLLSGCSAPSPEVEQPIAEEPLVPSPIKTWNATYAPSTWGIVQAGGFYAKPTAMLGAREYTCIFLDMTGLRLLDLQVTSTWSDGTVLEVFSYFRSGTGPYDPEETKGTSPLTHRREFPGEESRSDLFIGTGVPAGQEDPASVGTTADISMTVAVAYLGDGAPQLVNHQNCDSAIHRPI